MNEKQLEAETTHLDDQIFFIPFQEGGWIRRTCIAAVGIHKPVLLDYGYHDNGFAGKIWGNAN